MMWFLENFVSHFEIDLEGMTACIIIFAVYMGWIQRNLKFDIKKW